MTERAGEKVAIVTGAGGDIGRAIVKKLRSDGFQVLAADVDGAAAARVAADDRDIHSHACDVTDQDAVHAMASVARQFGPVQVLVNNAGRATALSLKSTNLKGWQHDLRLNLEAAYICFEAVAEDLKSHEGRLINIASVNGLGVYGHPAYSAAKAGLIHFTRLVAVEYGKYGVHANAVAPGSVRTQAWEARAAANPDVWDEVRRWYPLQRIARTEDVANAVSFLAGPSASAISGVCLPVDCGLTAGQAELAHTFSQSEDY